MKMNTQLARHNWGLRKPIQNVICVGWLGDRLI